MKVTGWVTTSLDINHGQHYYKGTIERKNKQNSEKIGKIKAKVDFNGLQYELKGKTTGKCVVKCPKHISSCSTFSQPFADMCGQVFADIKNAAQKNGYLVDKMKLVVKIK